MKSKEFIDEGAVGNFLRKTGAATKDYFARAGWLGHGAQQAAYGRRMEREVSQAKKISFITNLEKDLIGAIRAGLVVESKEIMKFEDFDRLFESKFLTEAVSISQFVKDWTMAWAAKNGVSIPATNEADIERLATQFQANYRAGRFPKADAENMLNALTAIKSTQSAQSAMGPGGLARGYGFPKNPVTVEISGNDYKFVTTPAKQWQDESGNVITDPSAVDILNKTAYEQSKTTGKQYPDPTDNVPVDAAAGKTWKPTGARNNYTFNKTDGKWRIGTLSSTKVIDDANTVNLLNKAYAEQGALE